MTLMPVVLELPIWKVSSDQSGDHNFCKSWKDRWNPIQSFSTRIKSFSSYLKQQGFQDSDIMRVTGHSTAEMYMLMTSPRAQTMQVKKLI